MSGKIGLIGRKIGMTRIFDETGKDITVTVISAGPCPIIEIKKDGKEKYNALRIAYKEEKEGRLNKPQIGVFKKVNLKPYRYIKELRIENNEEYKVGNVLDVGIFKEGEYVDVTGVTKGKGFQGVVKRWGFSGGPKTRGQSDRHRAPGSIGMNTFPARVWKNKRMAGRMGGVKKTVQNLRIIKINKDNNLILLKGSVAGTKDSIIMIKKAVKKVTGDKEK